jgi:hypothetical protein
MNKEQLVHWFGRAALDEYQTMPFMPSAQNWLDPLTKYKEAKLHHYLIAKDKATEKFIDLVLEKFSKELEMVFAKEPIISKVAEMLYTCNSNSPNWYIIDRVEVFAIMFHAIPEIKKIRDEIFGEFNHEYNYTDDCFQGTLPYINSY